MFNWKGAVLYLVPDLPVAILALIEPAAQAKGSAIRLSKAEDLQQIMGYGIMSIPGGVIGSARNSKY